MKIVNHKQGTKEWREWRGTGLGASDAPAVMGDSPWTSPFQLWLDKTGLYPRPEPNEYQLSAMRRGNELEPVARAMFEKQVGKSYPPLSAHHDDYVFLRASFDGYNQSDNSILEIKCPNKIDHERALNGKVPKKYIAQVQQQLLISGAHKCYYYSWDGRSESGAIVEVLPDSTYQAILLATLIDFWTRVVHKILPEVTTEEVAVIVKEMNEALERASKAGKVLDLLTRPEKTNKKELKDVKLGKSK